MDGRTEPGRSERTLSLINVDLRSEIQDGLEDITHVETLGSSFAQNLDDVRSLKEPDACR